MIILIFILVVFSLLYNLFSVSKMFETKENVKKRLLENLDKTSRIFRYAGILPYKKDMFIISFAFIIFILDIIFLIAIAVSINIIVFYILSIITLLWSSLSFVVSIFNFLIEYNYYEPNMFYIRFCYIFDTVFLIISAILLYMKF